MKKLVLLLAACLLFGLAMPAGANEDRFEVGQTWDDSILAGGIYDMYVWVGDNAEDYTYQWQVDTAFGDGHWYDLEDNADPYGYAGTDTYHLQLITPRTNGYIIGTGWEDIPFQCVVTSKKTGVSVTSASMFMHVYTSDDLTDYMAKKGIELYTPSVEGAGKATTTDDITYYASVESGKPATFMCGFKPPQNDPLMGRSDMMGNVEVWITEDGKTVRRDDGGLYTPYTIGKNTVTVEFKLHYTLGIHDLGYYQTKTLKLSTNEPAVIGRGTAKQQMSLLKEPYGQSQTLTTIPKGGMVHVHTNSGSWYKVSYGGYVGYVAGSSLNYEDYVPVIDHVDVTVAEPVAGALPATSCTVSPNSCTATYVDWMDRTENRFMDPGERFQKGHAYRLIVWAAAKDGYEFKLDGNDNMLTTAIINGKHPAFTTRAYEQIIGKVVEIYYDFANVKEEIPHTCSLTPVSRVEPTCTAEGHQAYYKCSCGKTYADAAGTQEVSLSVWGVIPAKGHKEGSWTGNGTHHYKKCTVCLTVIPGTNAPHSGGNATCQQKPTCATCGMQYGQLAEHKWSEKQLYQEDAGHAYACEYPSCAAHDTLTPHIPGPEATDTEPQKCTVCQYIIAPVKNHTHSYVKMEAKAATCLSDGNSEYYTCSGCPQWWLDAAGTKPIADKTSVILPALGHFTGEHWQFNEETHWQSCVVCMQPVEEGRGSHTFEEGKCQICGYSADAPMPTAPAQPQPTTPADHGRNGSAKQWLLPVLVALVCFGAAVTTTVIILKKKG